KEKAMRNNTAFTSAFATVAVVALALAGAVGCGQAVPNAKQALAHELPVAVLSCPDTAQAGVAFSVDGSKTTGTLKADQTHLKIAPGTDDINALSGSFTVASAMVATVNLFV